MKKIIHFFIIMFVFSTFSCSNFLDEQSKDSLNVSNFFQSGEDLILACHPLYDVFMNFTGGDDPISLFCGSDDVTSNVPANTYFRDFDIFNVSDGLSQITVMWQVPYAGITRANFIISNYADVPDCTEELRNNCAGQAYFSRAWWYFWLVKYFGPVPMPLSTNESNTEMEKSSVEEIYTQIISDLKNAEQMLPVHQTSEDWTENGYSIIPTQGTAKSLLASVYLQMTGWPLKQTDKYALAAAKAKEVIDNESTYGYGLVAQDELWAGETLWDAETVFGHPYNYPTGDYTMRTPKAGSPIEEGGWACYMAEINFFKKFPEGPRKDATFQTNIWLPVDVSEEGAFYDKRSDSWWIEVPWDDSRTYKQHPYYAKQRFGSSRNGSPSWSDRYLTGDMWRSGRTQRFIRYAEVLLVYAEAQAMANNGADASAYSAINRVRQRAGLEDLPAGMSASEFQEACFDERGWEFAGFEYCSRWADLLRFEKVEEKSSNRAEGEYELHHSPTKADYYLPIPASEKNKNSNLSDNNGSDY
ncbi:MAG: RagB/SusD family nutrient uptake outer membrane protein [Massilibacteroides sp.]|nr:RagB/SusD family nutrient uptake outer membrane protein [Massilibacteroides sp.]MDD4115992.1 RagB/SusD family nutrient uptake outer membrane protein [Massilibacteroides sp.]MDD4661636.1 RagB/SusD family nutrient uptake outer membrane protein [Massilibacteroides sp.]